MTKEITPHPTNQALIKFSAPNHLKDSLTSMATERSISLSALLRIISTEYIKRNPPT